MIRQAFGSMFVVTVPSETPSAQWPPYCGAYLAGSSMNRSRFSALAKYQVAPSHCDEYSAEPSTASVLGEIGDRVVALDCDVAKIAGVDGFFAAAIWVSDIECQDRSGAHRHGCRSRVSVLALAFLILRVPVRPPPATGHHFRLVHSS